MGRVSREDYRFLKIVDATTALNQKVSLTGIIVEHGMPTRSRGTDWFCTLRIVDETYHNRGLLVNIFAEAQELLPQVEASGDILLLSSVQMKTHNNETYALFNKRYSSFALFEGKYGKSCKPYQASVKFRQRQQDMTIIVGLRKWADGIQLDTVSKDSVLLRQLKEGQCFDLVCKILRVAEVRQDEWMLFIWDGSDAPPLQLQSESEKERECALPLQVEAEPLPRDILSKFPTVGAILRVSVQQRSSNVNVTSLTAGRWVKFLNMAFKVYEGLWCGVVTSETKVRFVPSDDSCILERQRESELRFSAKTNRMPFTSFPWPSRITEVDSKVENVPLVTLMDIVTYAQVTAKFKCVVRTVAALPCAVEDFRSPAGPYRIRVTLEDPTARIHAYLYAEDAEVFFEGYPPVTDLTRKWNALLGVAEADSGGEVMVAPRNPPWVLCCIKSYYIDENDVWGSRRFRIFNTKLVS